nr:subtype B tannase [uncultured Holophaga sp.]
MALKPLALSGLALALSASLTAAEVPDLVFHPEIYTVQSAELNGRTIRYRAYEGLVTVKHPVDTRYETLNLFVPVEYFEGKSVGTYSAKSAPILLPNSVGGYMPGPAGRPGPGFGGQPNAALVALSKGLVVAAPGARGRTLTDAQGHYTGKAPAAIVDLKAAVRYLRFNAQRLPAGDTEKIISNGTSAGGALSALLGATGNAPEYEPYLQALGAAETRDDVFAVSAYCPITDLDHADMAYEWLFSDIHTYQGQRFPPMGGPGGPGAPGMAYPGGPDGVPSRPPLMDPAKMPPAPKQSMTATQVRQAAELKRLFPAYLNSLGLKDAQGHPLTLDAKGHGSFEVWIRAQVVASAQRALDQGQDLSKATYLRITRRKVTGIDFPAYLKAIGRMKATSAFDGTDLGTGENSLFGSATLNARHFTAYGQQHDTRGGTLAEAQVIALMNPMAFIGKAEVQVSAHWRIRHGAADRDTASAVPSILALTLQQQGKEVDFSLPWGQGHGGDYDLDELFAWVEKTCR